MLERARVGWPRPLPELKNLLYEVYLAAEAPSLDEIARGVAADSLPGSPSRDTIRRIIRDPSLPPSQADAVAVGSVLARLARWDVQDLVGRVRGLCVWGGGGPVGHGRRAADQRIRRPAGP